MAIKIYQPHRHDLLINTAWGIPREQLTEGKAAEAGLTLLDGRWVSREELQRLRDEANAYTSLRLLAVLLLLLAVLSVVWTAAAMEKAGPIGLLVLIPGAASLAGGLGLLRYAPWGRYSAALVFALMVMLPFVPLGSDDKGAPLLLVFGALGLYYLFRGPAGRIFKEGSDGG